MAETTPYADLTVDELKAELEARELPKSGKKDELIARLEDDDAGQSGGAAEDQPVAETEAVEEAAEEARRRAGGEAQARPSPRRCRGGHSKREDPSTATRPAPRDAQRGRGSSRPGQVRAQRAAQGAPGDGPHPRQARGRRAGDPPAHAPPRRHRHREAPGLGRGERGEQLRAGSRGPAHRAVLRGRGAHDQALPAACAGPRHAHQQAHQPHDDHAHHDREEA